MSLSEQSKKESGRAFLFWHTRQAVGLNGLLASEMCIRDRCKPLRPCL